MGILSDEYKKAMEQSAREDANGDREFEELEDGFYLAKLEKVVLVDKVGDSGFKQVRLQWRMIRPNKNRVQSEFISLSPRAAWKMREIFDATGYTYDSDLEEVVGEPCILQIEQREQQRGQRKGEMVADVVGHEDPEDPTFKALIGK